MHLPVADQILTSRTNPQVKRLLHLHARSKRKAGEVFLIEGLREVHAALRAGVKLEGLYFAEGLFRSGSTAGGLLAEARAQGVPLIALTPALFEKVSTREGPDGVLAVGQAWVKRLEDIQVKKDPLFLMVEGVEKPGNLGALMRSAESAGVDALILCDAVIDPLSPSVIRNSQGAVFTIPFVEASQAEVAAFFSVHGITTVATTPAASTLYWAAELRGPLAILMGSEKAGLTPFWLSQADLQVKIPLMGAADSLNLATAAVLTLYEALRQRLLK